MLKSSLRDLSLFTVIFALCLGLGVNQYRMSTRVWALDRHSQRLLHYSRSLHHELKSAQKAHQELSQTVPQSAAFCDLSCRSGTHVRWEVLNEPEPQIGFKSPNEIWVPRTLDR
jgi:hypothetical protein